MGRKKGQQQRTKGNVLPSSSVRSADLLTKDGINTGLGLFHTLPSAGLGNIPELAGLDSIANIEFRTALKKLYKRDVTTKLKGLSEFADLCRSCQQHEVLTVLPYWPRIYNRLFEDSDRRVRESAQKAMHAIVVASGKNLALQLKNLMGCWFISQCDPYAPSALATEVALDQAFSGNKKVEAFAFCRKEILKCIMSYLFGPQTKREKLSEPEEANFHRMMGSSLDALSLYIRRISKQNSLADELEEIISNSKFWKFQKHTSSPVRGGFYSVIESLCVVAPDLLKTHLTEACKSIFHRLDESNIAVCRPLYEAAVAVVATYDSWHESVDIFKGVIPGLCGILRSGCHGFGAFVLPSLLPILANIPGSADLVVVFSKIFDAVKICLDHDQIKHSKRGTEQAITAYIELLRLCVNRILQETEGSDAKEKLPQLIMDENILYILNKSFAHKGSSNTLLYKLISGSIHSWTAKQASDSYYKKLCDSFWKGIDFVIDGTHFSDEISTALELKITLLEELLQCQTLTKAKKQRRSVKFEADGTSQNLPPSDVTTDIPKLPEAVFSSMEENVNKIVIDNLLTIPLKESPFLTSIYRAVFEKLVNPPLFKSICKRKSVSAAGSNSNEVGQYIERILIPEAKGILAGEEPSDNVVETLSSMLYNALRHCKDQDSFPFNITAMLEYITSDAEFLMSLCFFWHLTANLQNDLKMAFWVTNLLKNSDSVTWKFLENIADNVGLCNCAVDKGLDAYLDKKWKILENIFTSCIEVDGEVKHLCNEGGFLRVSKRFLNNVEKAKANCSVCPDKKWHKFANLMLACVKRNFNMASLVTDDGKNIWDRLMTELLKIAFRCKGSGSELLHSFADFFDLAAHEKIPFVGENSVDIYEYIGIQAKWIKDNLINRNFENEVAAVNSFADVILDVTTSQEMTAVTFLINLLPDAEEWEEIRGFHTTSPFLEELLPDLSKDGSVASKLAENFSPGYEVLRVFEKTAVHLVSKLQDRGTVIVWKEKDKILTLAEELAVASVVEKSYKNELTFFSSFNADFGLKFRSKLLEKSLQYGGIWPYCVHFYGPHFSENELDDACNQILKVCQEHSEISLSLFQTVVVLIHYMTEDQLDKILPVLLDVIVVTSAKDVSESEIYMFSLAVLAVTKTVHKDKLEFVKTLFALTIEWRKGNEDLFLFDDNFAQATKSLLLLNSSVADLFSLTVQQAVETLTDSEWDFMRCALVSWMENVSISVKQDDERKYMIQRLLRSACMLLDGINVFISSPTALNDPTVPSNLIPEWIDFFSVSIYTSLVKSFIDLGNSETPTSVIKAVCKCLENVPEKSIIESASNLKPKLSPDSSLPHDVQTISNHLISLICPSQQHLDDTKMIMVQVTVFKLTSAILERLATPETASPPDTIFNITKKLSAQIEPLFVSQEIETLKSHHVIEDSEDDEDIEEASGSGDLFKENILMNITAVVGYLLSWKLLINLTEFITPEHKAAYINTLVKGDSFNLADDLLSKLYKLMVGKVAYFKTNPEMNFVDGIKMEDVEHVAASLYQDFLTQMPAASRVWFNELTKAARSRVDKFTSTYVTPVLIEREFRAVQATKQQQTMEGMDIVARPVAREVHASYKLNEIQMEISVCLSHNHPLGPITVNTEKRAGVVMGQWRYWILQITMFLQYQNGGIIDGLLLWKDKVDKRFEGLEECMICFSVVHGSSQSLPKLKCKTCKKKYHGECLYKWFDTSNNSSCPLCRSPMIFR